MENNILLTAEEARKFVDEETKNDIYNSIINKINGAIKSKYSYVTISASHMIINNYTISTDNSENEMYNFIDNDVNGIKTLLISKGYLVVRKISKKRNTYLGNVIPDYYYYEISW